MFDKEQQKHEELKRLKVIKVNILASLLFSTRYFFREQHGRKFVVGNHHEIICRELDDVLDGKCTRLIINIAPRYGKTECAVKQFIAKGLGINPASKFIHLSYSDSLALDNSEDVKELVESVAYQNIFPLVKLKPDSQSKKKWKTTAGGGVYATSAGGQVTGFGAGTVDEEDDEEVDLLNPDDELEDEDFPDDNEGFGGAIIIDDPIKPDDADSEVKRERVNNRFFSTIESRVNSRNTPIVVIMQRTHPDDLVGHLIKKQPRKWRVISLPVINQPGNEFNLPAGQALWPFKHTLPELKEKEEANKLVFARQYMQDDATQEGKLFAKDILNFYNPASVDVKKLREFSLLTIDPADEGGDDLSGPTGSLIGNKIYIENVFYNKDGTDVNEPAISEYAITEGLESILIESNSAWILFAKNIRLKVIDRHPDCYIRTVKNTTNKHTRILSASSWIINNCVFRSDYESIPQYFAFMKVLFNYNKDQSGSNKNKKDDAPDSLACMAKFFQTRFRHLWYALSGDEEE